MEKMISVINDNLKSIIDGIKEHYEELESMLDKVSKEITNKVKQASVVKDDILNSKTIIEALENEIASLENDLSELSEKFKDKDFKEIIAAGNKEINAKIIEKRASINENGQNILILTDEAKNIKEQLANLKNKKATIEENLLKTKALENYYNEKISEIINYSVDHIDELETYYDDSISIIDEINDVLDDSIFEEIASIPDTEPDEALLENVLKNPDEIPVYSVETEKDNDEIVTSELENMIEIAKKIIADHNNFEKTIENEYELEEVSEQTKENEALEEKTSEEDSATEKSIKEDVLEESDETSAPQEYLDNLFKDEYLDINLGDEPENEETKENIIETENNNLPSEDDNVDASSSEIDLSPLPVIGSESNQETGELSDTELINDLIRQTEEALSNQEENQDIKLAYEEDEAIQPQINLEKSEDDFVINADSFNSGNQDENIEAAIENVANEIKAEDVVLESANVEYLKASNITDEVINENIKAINDMNSDDLHKIMKLISKTDAKTEDINLLFKYIINVDILKLEESINNGNKELTSVLASSLTQNSDIDISDSLKIDKKVLDEFKKNATDEELEIFNKIPDVIIKNYRELDNFKVENINDCFSKHPHRFTITPSAFFEILDKYDPEDLVRCINKNVAVIDKL